jgi:hypothetical protein
MEMAAKVLQAKNGIQQNKKQPKNREKQRKS